MKFIKMHGLQRTRSCYIQDLIKFNFSDCLCLANVGGWKHGPVQEELDWSGKTWEQTEKIAAKYFDENMKTLNGQEEAFEEAFKKNEVLYLFTVRNFYDSYVSRIRSPIPEGGKKKPKDYVPPRIRKEFLQAMLHNWNEINRHYLAFIAQNNSRGAIVRYEDLKTEEKKLSFVNKLGTHFSLDTLSPDPEAYYDIKPRVEPRGLKSNWQSVFEEAPTYSKLHIITDEELEYIQKNICPQLCKILKYQVLDAANRP